MTPLEQHRHLATLQKRWEHDAFSDMRYNLNRAAIERRHGNLILARGYEQEASWDQFWGNRRAAIVKREGRFFR